MKRPFSLVWWDHPRITFELRTPWWTLAERTIQLDAYSVTTQHQIQAAVMATSPEDAKNQIIAAYDCEIELNWLVVQEQPMGWSPFGNQNTRGSGMIWDQRPH